MGGCRKSFTGKMGKKEKTPETDPAFFEDYEVCISLKMSLKTIIACSASS